MNDTERVSPRRFIAALPLIVFSGLAVIFLVMLFTGDPKKIPSALIGQRAPEIQLEPLPGLVSDGAPVDGFSLGKLPENKITLMNVWASWCVPCRTEHPQLMALSRRPDVRLLGMNYKDQPENARRFLGVHGNPFERVGIDPSGRAAIDWGVYGVPETFVVDAQGIIRHKLVGPITPSGLKSLLSTIEDAKREYRP